MSTPKKDKRLEARVSIREEGREDILLFQFGINEFHSATFKRYQWKSEVIQELKNLIQKMESNGTR